MSSIYDMIVLGGGPAGYTAALYAARAGFSALVIERMAPGGQMTQTELIENFPGFEQGIDGFTLGEKMQKTAERFGVMTVYAEITEARLKGEIKRVATSMGEYLGKTAVIATGAGPKSLGIPGEAELWGRGVHTCAHCDGRFYRGRRVAVVGGGNSAAADALYLSRLAERVTVIHRRDTLRAEKASREPLLRAENVEFLWNTEPLSFQKSESGITVSLKDVSGGNARERTFDGVFVSIGRRPATDLFREELLLDGEGYIVADESTRTGLPGVYAVGDVREKPLRQIVTAVGDGAVAAHFAEEYLSRL